MSIRQNLISYGGGSAGDPSYANVSIYTRFNGTNGSTTYTDEKGVTWTADGVAPPTISTAQSKFGGASLFLDNAGGNLKTAYSSALQFPGDFTVEFWFRLISKGSNYQTLVGNYDSYAANGGFALFVDHLGGAPGKFTMALNGAYPAITSSTSITYGVWHNMALVRSGSTVTLYLNGVNEGTTTYSGTIQGTSNFWWLGASGDLLNDTRLNGYIDELRVTKGVARYTSNFTPQTVEFPNF